MAWRMLWMLFSALLPISPAHAEDGKPVVLNLAYTMDFASVRKGAGDRKVRVLDNFDAIADLDLNRLIGLRGLHAHAYVLANHGARPNDFTGTLQGIDNIEVGDSGVRLFEAWLDQDIGAASLRAGLYDLNSEFYVVEAADLFLAPPFGIGSELAASGSNGPSIFPSSSLGARLRVSLGHSGSAVQAAVLNARAETLGDVHGIDTSFEEGVLVITEAQYASGNWHASLGGWFYSRPREAYYPTPSTSERRRRAARGVYAHAEGALLALAGGELSGFARVGFSGGGTTPFAWSGQTGLLLAPALSGHHDSALSLGLAYSTTSEGLRDELRDAGERPAASEYTIELTAVDRVAPFLLVQPDLQVIAHPGARQDVPTTIVAMVRLTFQLP